MNGENLDWGLANDSDYNRQQYHTDHEDEPVTRRTDERIEDLAACSAAYLTNFIPDLAALHPSAAFARLESHFRACLLAFRDGLTGHPIVPSEN